MRTLNQNAYRAYDSADRLEASLILSLKSESTHVDSFRNGFLKRLEIEWEAFLFLQTALVSERREFFWVVNARSRSWRLLKTDTPQF